MIEDTSRRDPKEHVMGSLVEGRDGYITGMESAGQSQLVQSEQLPVDGFDDDILALGIVRGDNHLCDDLFVNATLPEGWSRRRSDHAMWSYLVDERGVRRVAIFYKAAFYDRRASMRPEQPGYSLASNAIYGDGAVELPGLWSVLTDDEKVDFHRCLDRYLADAARHPDIYDRVSRAKRLIQLVTATEAQA
jgi:hypothetical protein